MTKIILGNGANDTVSALFSQYDTITLGNGAGDSVSIYNNVYIGSQYERSPSAMALETR